MSNVFVSFSKDVEGSKREKANVLYFLFGYLPLILGFFFFGYMLFGLANWMDRIIYFLAGGDATLGLLGINLLLIGSLISAGSFFLGFHLLSRGDPDRIFSRKNINLWRFGFLSGKWLMLVLTAICLAFLIWLALSSFPLLYTGIRIAIIYFLLFSVFIWRTIVNFRRRKGL